MMNNYFHPFVLPFTVGVFVLFSVLIYKFVSWFIQLAAEDRRLVGRSIFTVASLKAIWDVARESLLHVKIFKASGRLGYMHMSLALGWFLLIVVGKLETTAYLKDGFNWPHVHVFFRYFFHDEGERFEHYFNYKFIMDFLLLFVFSGVALAYFKRLSPKSLGIKKTTRHTTADRLAMTSLWLIFPARLLAESITCGINHTGSFLTNTFGDFLGRFLPLNALEVPAWFFYSSALGLFFVAFPFSRYMHIFAEIPHIFLKRYKVQVGEKEGAIDKFQIAACSRCGICIDPCQMQRQDVANDMQAVYFLRDRRSGIRSERVANNCLMCGRCENICPVGIDLNALRLNTKVRLFEELTEGLRSENRYGYLSTVTTSDAAGGKVGYFAGCMTALSPTILRSMDKIFEASGDTIWRADSANGSVCCGRPMELVGDLAGAKKLMELNRQQFIEAGIETLVTSCPICLKVFAEKYDLKGIKVIHHSQYIASLMDQGMIKIMGNPKATFTYHDPCELGRGMGVYAAPREVIGRIGTLIEAKEHGKNALCCAGSLANTEISDQDKLRLTAALTSQTDATGAQTLVSACPMCKKSLIKTSSIPVKDISEVVADQL